MVSYRSDLAVPSSRVEMALKITDFPGLLRYPVKAYRLVMGMSTIQQAFVRFHACRHFEFLHPLHGVLETRTKQQRHLSNNFGRLEALL